MKKLKEKSDVIIGTVPFDHQRNVVGNINWEWRMNGIVGARGAGKTTLLLQKLRQLQTAGYDVLYVRLDDFYFVENRPDELADIFRKEGGEYLYLDEVHKYDGWARVLKNIYDAHPALKIAFSGSSIIELSRQEADLSRRALMYEMAGLSFREYLHMKGILTVPAFPLTALLANHNEIARDIFTQIPILKHFKQYLKAGYYPFFLEPHRDYLATLEQIIRTVIEVDLRHLESFDVAKSRKMLTLLRIIAASAPFKPNVSKLSQKTQLHRQTILQYLHHLEKAKLIKLVNQPNKYISRLQKPDKIYLDNPNLFFALNPENVNIGSLRETFVVNQLSVNHEVVLHQTADLMVDDTYVFEIGGRNKTGTQIKDVPNAYLLVDDLEIGHGRRIPLWLMGFLY